jgi:hypothetical protein
LEPTLAGIHRPMSAVTPIADKRGLNWIVR